VADFRPQWVQDLYRRLGHEIRKVRNEKNLTQEKLAQALGLSRPAVANIEKGRQGIDVFRLHEIATVLEIPVVDLLQAGIGPKPESSPWGTLSTAW